MLIWLIEYCEACGNHLVWMWLSGIFKMTESSWATDLPCRWIMREGRVGFHSDVWQPPIAAVIAAGGGTNWVPGFSSSASHTSSTPRAETHFQKVNSNHLLPSTSGNCSKQLQSLDHLAYGTKCTNRIVFLLPPSKDHQEGDLRKPQDESAHRSGLFTDHRFLRWCLGVSVYNRQQG